MFWESNPTSNSLLTAIGFWSNCVPLKCSNKLAILEYFHTETFEVALISETSQAFPNGRQAPRCFPFQSISLRLLSCSRHGTQLQGNLKGDVSMFNPVDQPCCLQYSQFSYKIIKPTLLGDPFKMQPKIQTSVSEFFRTEISTTLFEKDDTS